MLLGEFHLPGPKVLGGVAILAILAFVAAGRFFTWPRMVVADVSRYAIEKEAIVSTLHYQTLETPHFLIKYQGDQEEAKAVAASAESMKEQVDEFFGHPIEGKTVVVIYPDSQSMAKNLGWPQSQSAMGVYFGGTIRVLSPQVWISEPDWQSVFAQNGPMIHEYTHYQVDLLTHGNYPRWFTEGMAQYMEKKMSGFQFEVPAGAHDHPYTLDELDKDFDNLDEAQAYWQSLTAVEYIADNYGEGALGIIIDRLGQGESMAEALQAATGSYNSLEAELQACWLQ